MELFLGVDVGSSGCKAIAITQSGAVIATGYTPYSVCYPRPGLAEQNPEQWYQAACQSIAACLSIGNIIPGNIQAVSFAGPAHNAALMDEGYNLLYPTIHWSDLRSVSQSQWLEANYGEQIFAITYQKINPSWTLSQLLWIKENEPGIWKKIRRVLITKDYVRFRMTGNYSTDVYDAIGTQLYDIRSGCWSKFICDLLGIDLSYLPSVLNGHQSGGKITTIAAAECGLKAGTPVAVGSGDSVVEALGVGVISPGQGIVKLGTSANVDLVTSRPIPDLHTITYPHLINGFWFTIAATNSGTASLKWFKDTFCRLEIQEAQKNNLDVYALINHMAMEANAGSAGLLFHPYLMGERSPYWDPELRGDFVGISSAHSLNHFARAILEGVAFSILDCYLEVVRLGQPINELRLIGGGSKSSLWSQIVCDVLGLPLNKPTMQDAAFGAALLAGISSGAFCDFNDAVHRCIEVKETLKPDQTLHEFYMKYYEVYKDVTCALTKYDHRLVNISNLDKGGHFVATKDAN